MIPSLIPFADKRLPKILPNILGRTIFDRNPILDIASLHSYWDISDIDTLWIDSAKSARPVDGDPVGYIADKSGNGNDLQQTVSGARPLYRTNNGQPYLEFTGSSYLVSTAALGTYKFLHNGAGAQWYTGWNVDALPNNDQVFLWGTEENTPTSIGALGYYRNYPPPDHAAGIAVYNGTGTTSLLAIGADDSFTSAQNTLISGLYGVNGSVFSMSMDGTVRTSGTATSPSASNESSLFKIGTHKTVVNNFIRGNFYGMSIFETGTALSASDDSAVSDYWNDRMGI